MGKQELIEFRIERQIRAPKWKVFSGLLRMSEFEKFMPNVKESKLLEAHNGTNKTKTG